MLHPILLGLSLLGVEEATAPALPTGPFNNEYVIHATLDVATFSIVGEARVTFRNFGATPISTIPFRLYPNAWSATDTAWVKDARAEATIERRGEAGAGYMRIDSVALENGADLGSSTTIEETIMRVTLPAPLAPQESAAFVIRFATKLPLTVARMGRVGRHVDAMQWFPKLCAHVGDRFVDWPFREPTEFFANFGKYEVAITLPKEYVIEATGRTLRDEVDETAGTKTVTFAADAVHDFAWTADPNFVRSVDRSRDGTEIVLLSQPFLAPKDRLVLDATKLALDRYAEWIFPYPYERVVIDVLPPGLSGGMEYPGLFTISARAPEALHAIASRSESPASVTIHEFGHQYWYGIVATNEFEDAWLDEGINTYLTAKLLEELFPEPRRDRGPRGIPAITRKHVVLPALVGGGPLSSIVGYDTSSFLRPELARPGRRAPEPNLFGFALPELILAGERVDRFRERMASYAPVADVTFLDQHSWDTYPHHPKTSYTAMAYSKPTLALATLEGVIGFDAMKDLLRTWARRHAFRHPTTADFLALADEKLAAPHAAFLRACVQGRDTVDWSVDSVSVAAVAPRRGFTPQRAPGDPITADFGEPRHEKSLLDRLLALAKGEAPKTVAEPAAPQEWTATVVVRNRGRLEVPTTLELVFADGSKETRELDGAAPWQNIELPASSRKLVSATVDPQRKIALDLDLTNNARLATRDKEPSITLAAYSQFWVQSLFAGAAWLF